MHEVLSHPSSKTWNGCAVSVSFLLWLCMAAKKVSLLIHKMDSVWYEERRSDHIQFLLRGATEDYNIISNEEHFNLPVDIFGIWQETRGIFHLNKIFGNVGKRYRNFLQTFRENLWLKKMFNLKVGTVQPRHPWNIRRKIKCNKKFSKRNFQILECACVVDFFYWKYFKKFCSVNTENFHKFKLECS